ncbi:hypothetical protein FGO68_gene14942 [Halteria grandinella]|uniref:C2 domain-containing protein n=1 Tax=Halteria grandinella TaxID=5974 RepID=A0A8J8NX04_HALGN|nr:hypothetical protein FGO68_gene14942 [Halteria grandinella]
MFNSYAIQTNSPQYRSQVQYIISLTIVRGRLFRDTEIFGQMDPFIRIIHKGNRYQTKVHDEAGKNPEWNETFNINLENFDDPFQLTCYDEDVLSDDFIGEASFRANQLCGEQANAIKREWHALVYKGQKSAEILIEGRLLLVGQGSPTYLNNVEQETTLNQKQFYTVNGGQYANMNIPRSDTKGITQVMRNETEVNADGGGLLMQKMRKSKMFNPGYASQLGTTGSQIMGVISAQTRNTPSVHFSTQPTKIDHKDEQEDNARLNLGELSNLKLKNKESSSSPPNKSPKEEDKGSIRIEIIEAKLTRDTETFGKMDPYVELTYDKDPKLSLKTKTINEGGKNVKWNETFTIALKSEEEGQITLKVMDEDIGYSDLVGEAVLEVAKLIESFSNQANKRNIPILYKDKKAGELTIDFRHIPPLPQEEDEEEEFGYQRYMSNQQNAHQQRSQEVDFESAAALNMLKGFRKGNFMEVIHEQAELGHKYSQSALSQPQTTHQNSPFQQLSGMGQYFKQFRNSQMIQNQLGQHLLHNFHEHQQAAQQAAQQQQQIEQQQLQQQMTRNKPSLSQSVTSLPQNAYYTQNRPTALRTHGSLVSQSMNFQQSPIVRGGYQSLFANSGFNSPQLRELRQQLPRSTDKNAELWSRVPDRF